MKDKSKYTLLTNLQYVIHNDVRLHCHALLITEGEDAPFNNGKRTTLRGFGTEASWEAFDIHLTGEVPWTISPPTRSSGVLISHGGKVKPLATGAILKLGDGEWTLWADNGEQPIDVHSQTGDIMMVWAILYEKTAQYWHAPYMPRLTYGPPSIAGNYYREWAVAR